ncbi:ankyrin repeat domain-containing protein [Bordetella genomosp. 4]|uniref:Uncharacterized protein n=1 Tax=Bordetella genomosp. 4 TaxID=463044 RepID=A0A261UB76_9BORD|nr:ankyrin repeat domain-containing protein [Bordetella genomosp. 4]OZI59164.1 hypothetical protein CAL20_05950 [Bordetella genomosp. 4]
MLNELCFPPSRSPSIENRFHANPDTQNIRKALLEALEKDDWSVFEAAAFNDAETLIEKMRFDNGKNCLHVAVKTGSQSVALNLIKLAHERRLDLINSKDLTGYTPLMYAADSATDNLELVDALFNAGAREGLAQALKSAAQRGHVAIATRLVGTDVDAPTVLAEIIADDAAHLRRVKANAARLLIALGVSATDALAYAVEHCPEEAASFLFLLGANGADALASAANARDQSRLARLVSAGADVETALISLAKHPDRLVHYRDVSFLNRINYSERWRRWHETSRIDTAALLRLLKSGDTATMLTLARAIAPEHRGWDELAKSGNVEALTALRTISGKDESETCLRFFVVNGHWNSLKTLLDAGVPASRTLESLLRDLRASRPGSLEYRNFRESLKLLFVAGADGLPFPEELRDEINERKKEISSFSPSEVNAAFLSAITNKYTADAALLLDKGADLIAALQYLSQPEEIDDASLSSEIHLLRYRERVGRLGIPNLIDTGRVTSEALISREMRIARDMEAGRRSLGIRNLIDAGAVTAQTLIDRVKAGDMQVSRAIAKHRNIATDALVELIVQGDQETARVLVPTLTDGQLALTQAVRCNDLNLARALIEIGADGPGALLSLLREKHREVAGRLIALGVDVHTALMRAVREGHDSDKTAIGDLIMIGAQFSIALLRAVALGETETVKKILNLGGTSAATEALLTLSQDATLAYNLKASRLKQLIQAGLNTDRVLEQLIEDRKTAQLKTLIALGAPTVKLLIELSKQRNRIGARNLIIAGADFITAMRTLQIDGEQVALTVLVLALAGARERMVPAVSL